jgi:hypothetical protein
MQRILLGTINVDFDATDQLLIIYSIFVNSLTKNGNTMKQCTSYFYIVDFTKVYDSFKREVLYNILIEFGIPMKRVKLIKMQQSP